MPLKHCRGSSRKAPCRLLLPAAALALLLTTATPSSAANPLEEIVVTAQHREQYLAEVPISLTVFDGAALEALQVRNIDGLTGLTPGLSGWQQGLSTPIYALRGISTNSFGIGGESSIGLFVDDAYIGRINSAGVRMPDIERVEILKGPQGTLLGRNASAGAIHYHTRLPEQDPSLDLRLAAGEWQTREIAVTANTPLVGEVLAARVSGFYREQQGDVKNIARDQYVGGEDGHGLRLALAYNDGPWTVDFSVSNQSLDSGGLGYETLDPALAAAGGVSADPFDGRLATDIRTSDDIESDDANLRIEWRGSDDWRLRSITAWHRNDSPNLFDVDGSAVFLTSAGFLERDSETLSQEFRFSGKAGDIHWVSGISYFSEDVSTRIELGYSDTNRLNGQLLSPSEFGVPLPDITLCGALSDRLFGTCQEATLETAYHRGDYRSSGVYGDVSWELNKRLTLSAGLRYSYDDKDFKYRAAPVESVTTTLNALRTAPLNPAGNLLGYSTEGWQSLSEDWDKWQPRLAVSYQWHPSHSLYANLARGYKAGGFEPAATPELSVFAPETVSSMDIGLRGSWWRQRIAYDVAAYYYDNEDYQVQIIANGIARTVNSEGITGSGVEWSLIARPAEHWQLHLQGAYTEARFDKLRTDNGSFEDNRTILTPRHSVGLSVEYRSERMAWGSLGMGWQSEYQSDIYYSVQNLRTESRGDLQLHHLRLSYFAARDNWRLDFLARNLFDKDFTIYQSDLGAGLVARRGMPRQLLAQLSVRF